MRTYLLLIAVLLTFAKCGWKLPIDTPIDIIKSHAPDAFSNLPPDRLLELTAVDSATAEAMVQAYNANPCDPSAPDSSANSCNKHFFIDKSVALAIKAAFPEKQYDFSVIDARYVDAPRDSIYRARWINVPGMNTVTSMIGVSTKLLLISKKEAHHMHHGNGHGAAGFSEEEYIKNTLTAPSVATAVKVLDPMRTCPPPYPCRQ